MKVRRVCARTDCRAEFIDDVASNFITCEACRHPLPDVPGACTHWDGAEIGNPRVNRQERDLVIR